MRAALSRGCAIPLPSSCKQDSDRSLPVCRYKSKAEAVIEILEDRNEDEKVIEAAGRLEGWLARLAAQHLQ